MNKRTVRLINLRRRVNVIPRTRHGDGGGTTTSRSITMTYAVNNDKPLKLEDDPSIIKSLECIGAGKDSGVYDLRHKSYKELLAFSYEELKAKQSLDMSTWGLGDAKRWDVNQEVGSLVFTFPDKVAVCPVQFIGSWNSKLKTFLWSWANSSIDDRLKTFSIQIRQYGAAHGMKVMTTREITCDDVDAWMLSSLAVCICGAHGVYRGPINEQLFCFMAYGEPRISFK